MLLIGIILGGILGFLFHSVYLYWKEGRVQKKYIKRGLYTSAPNGFTRTYSDGSKQDYQVVAEIGMVERTKTKVKIEVLTLRTSINSDASNKNQVINIINGWRDKNDSEVEWFEPHPGDVRNKKIDKVLN